MSNAMLTNAMIAEVRPTISQYQGSESRQIDSFNSLEARKATFLLALISNPTG